jgi:arylsulfatase A-like enzyme
VWEGGIRVTWMAQWKGTVPGNRVVNDPVIQLDVLPTALAACSVVPPSGGSEPAKAGTTVLDGVNLLPLLKGETDKLAPRELYFRFGVQHAVRQGDWKLVKASKDMEPMLVNLATDPGEQRDLSAENPAKKAELDWLSSTSGTPACSRRVGRICAGMVIRSGRRTKRRKRRAK